MNLSIIKMTDDEGKFIIDGVTPSFINTLRRVMVSMVPKMAIDTVEFHLGSVRGEDGMEYESVTPLFDEMVAHRISLIPVPTNLEEFNATADCTCGGSGCNNCQLIYRLDKKGPSEKNQPTVVVYSGDLEPLNHNYNIKIPDIPIVTLGYRQALLGYVFARIGTANKHAKWQAAIAAGYKYYPSIDIKNNAIVSAKEIADNCPANVFKVTKNKLSVENLDACNHCKACEEMSEGAISVSHVPGKYLFQFETDGSFTARQVLEVSVKESEKLFKDLKMAISTV